MSICDSVCLISQFMQALFHMIAGLQDPKGFSNDTIDQLSMFCKADMYIMHATSAFSVWCWVMLSVLRYTAVFHPFKYRTIWRQPRNALSIMAIAGCLLEIWIPALVSYVPDVRGCVEHPDTHLMTIQSVHMLDILFAYVVPSILRIVLDGIVLAHCYRPNLLEIPVLDRRYGISAPSGQSALSNNNGGDKPTMNIILSFPRQSISYKREQFCKKKNAMIVRSLIISVVNICCNLPSHVLRVLWTVEPNQDRDDVVTSFLEAVSQLLYFGQFTCNALYLSTTIYETSTVPTKTYSVTIQSKINVSKLLDNDDV
uniref:G_PROTEIN_RECEP_F1_2 domain-containing protein n=1 Tax=Panagrellus redivivus TaxID=6233 RepID=A0A7E4ZW67_PANRE